MRLALILGICAPFAALQSAHAQHAGDIGLMPVGGRLTTGVFAGASFFPGQRVFQAPLGTQFPNFASDPGFDSLPGAFVPGARIGFTILDSLRRWNGADFSEIPPERLRISFGPVTPIDSPSTPQNVQGFSLSVGSNGEWHRHLQYTLLDPASDGVYLLSLQLWSDQGGIQPSAPFWLVFNQNRPAGEHDQAAQWAVVHLASGGDPACNEADIASVGETGEGPTTPDGQLTVDDLIAFVNLFSASTGCPGAAPCNQADIVGVGGPPEPPDGQLTVDDLIAFVNAFGEGC